MRVWPTTREAANMTKVNFKYLLGINTIEALENSKDTVLNINRRCSSRAEANEGVEAWSGNCQGSSATGAQDQKAFKRLSITSPCANTTTITLSPTHRR